jgi:hypothetical protein
LQLIQSQAEVGGFSYLVGASENPEQQQLLWRTPSGPCTDLIFGGNFRQYYIVYD